MNRLAVASAWVDVADHVADVHTNQLLTGARGVVCLARVTSARTGANKGCLNDD